MYPWFYVWSPRYRIFHEILQFATRDISGVTLNPIQVPQSIFERKLQDPSKHFLTGIGIKIHCLIKILESKKDEFIIFSDVDLIAPDTKLAEKLKEYEVNDITAMVEDVNSPELYNIGFMLIKNTPEVLIFFKSVLHRIQKDGLLDQDAFNEEIKSFSGKHAHFSMKDFIQSNMFRKDIWDTGNYSIVQCLSSDTSTYQNTMVGKLLTIIYYYDIRPILHHTEGKIIQDLQMHLILTNPSHYLLSVDLNTISFTDRADDVKSPNDGESSAK